MLPSPANWRLLGRSPASDISSSTTPLAPWAASPGPSQSASDEAAAAYVALE